MGVFKRPSLIILVFWTSFAPANQPRPAALTANVLEIRSVRVNGKLTAWHAGRDLLLGPSAENVTFAFGPTTNSNWTPTRLHYRVEGFDTAWRRGLSEMSLTMRFYNESRDIVAQTVFKAAGDSTGWNGSLRTSTLSHRRETITVPPRASRCMVVISSAGPPAAVGIYVVDDLVVSRVSTTNGPAQVLLRPLLGIDPTPANLNQGPRDWMPDGTRPSMARCVELGQHPSTRALAILDEDPIGHAEWHNLLEAAPRLASGDLHVMKHASASEVKVRVAFAEQQLTISIQDNGCGFQTEAQATGNGLANMKRRLQDLGGRCTVESPPGRGTAVNLSLVLQGAQPDAS